jgi:uncharacterized membrane protein YfcA
VDLATLLTVLGLGLVAGALTTVAGIGGGMLITLALSALGSPVEALAITTPALLVGNVHRAIMYRRHVVLRTALAFALGTLPGALAGGLVIASVPEFWMRVLLLLSVSAAMARKLGLLHLPAPRGSVFAGGLATGALSATTGGGGLIAGPTLLSAGTQGRSFVATMAIGSVAMHLGRIAAYEHGGLFTAGLLPRAIALAIAITLGNLLGQALAARVSPKVSEWTTHAMLVGGLLLALLGLAR